MYVYVDAVKNHGSAHNELVIIDGKIRKFVDILRLTFVYDNCQRQHELANDIFSSEMKKKSQILKIFCEKGVISLLKKKPL